VERVVRLGLSPQEIAGLQESASILTATIAQLDLE
jgi:hypothetical protein